MGDDACERFDDAGLREMSNVADLAVRLRRFLEYVESTYLFLAFMLGFLAITHFFVGLGEVLGLPRETMASIGSALGVAVSGVVYLALARRIFRVTGNRYARIFRGFRELLVYNAIVFLVWLAVVLIVEVVNPASLNLVWHPGLATMIIVVYLAKRSPTLRPHLIAALVMLPFTPVVILESAQELALGSMLLAYYAAGVYSLREALRVFDRG